MENALLVGLSRQMALAREFEIVANNVANAGTAGFKRRASVFNEFVATDARAENFRRPDRRVSFVIDQGAWMSTEQGPLERTGNPLDVAITGRGHFVVRGPDGEDRYTRDGAFALNAAGELVDSSGRPVMSDQGVVQFATTETDIRVLQDGSIVSSAGQRGTLRIAVFENEQALVNEGANLFSSPNAPRAPEPGEVRLEGGALERSNVKPVIEMSRLIEISRAYASTASLIQRTDEVRRTAIQRLGEPPAA
jgi:flagellar basal-body rod protein FlgF